MPQWLTWRHPLWTTLMLLLLSLPLLLSLIYFNLAAHVFELFGVSALGAVLVLAASLLGGLINLPLSRRRIELAPDPELDLLSPLLRLLLPFVHYYPPAVVEQVIALNVGGAIVPIAFSVYLFTLPQTSWIAALVATALVALATRLLARPVPGKGVTLPVFISPLVAAVVARALIVAVGAPVAGAAPVAYIAGTLGTLIGADLLNLPRILRGALVSDDTLKAAGASLFDPLWLPAPTAQRYIISIGGAGVFDGIFLTGIVAPLLAVL